MDECEALRLRVQRLKLLRQFPSLALEVYDRQAASILPCFVKHELCESAITRNGKGSRLRHDGDTSKHSALFLGKSDKLRVIGKVESDGFIDVLKRRLRCRAQNNRRSKSFRKKIHNLFEQVQRMGRQRLNLIEDDDTIRHVMEFAEFRSSRGHACLQKLDHGRHDERLRPPLLRKPPSRLLHIGNLGVMGGLATTSIGIMLKKHGIVVTEPQRFTKCSGCLAGNGKKRNHIYDVFLAPYLCMVKRKSQRCQSLASTGWHTEPINPRRPRRRVFALPRDIDADCID